MHHILYIYKFINIFINIYFLSTCFIKLDMDGDVCLVTTLITEPGAMKIPIAIKELDHMHV